MDKTESPQTSPDLDELKKKAIEYIGLEPDYEDVFCDPLKRSEVIYALAEFAQEQLANLESTPKVSLDDVVRLLIKVKSDIQRRMVSDEDHEWPFDEDLADAINQIDAALLTWPKVFQLMAESEEK